MKIWAYPPPYQSGVGLSGTLSTPLSLRYVQTTPTIPYAGDEQSRGRKTNNHGICQRTRIREEEENNLPQMKKLFFLYVWLNLTRIAELRKEDLVKHIRKRTIQTGRLFSSSSLTFKQHLLSLTQGTNNREAEKRTSTGFAKEPE